MKSLEITKIKRIPEKAYEERGIPTVLLTLTG